MYDFVSYVSIGQIKPTKECIRKHVFGKIDLFEIKGYFLLLDLGIDNDLGLILS